MATRSVHAGQSALFEVVSDEIELSPAANEAFPGIAEGEADDISEHIDFYARAIKEIGRARSNAIGFGKLKTDNKRVKEVALQHHNEDHKEVQEKVVGARRRHMDKAGLLLVRRAQLRMQRAVYWREREILSQADVDALPLVEDAYMLEGKWYGTPDDPADEAKSKARQKFLNKNAHIKKAKGYKS